MARRSEGVDDSCASSDAVACHGREPDDSRDDNDHN
jgi:hypothetical protein